MSGSSLFIAMCTSLWAGRTQTLRHWAEFCRSCGRSRRKSAEYEELVHLHAGHGGVVHVVVAMIVIIDGPDFCGIGFVGIDVDHPSENVGIEFSTGSLARFFGSD